MSNPVNRNEYLRRIHAVQDTIEHNLNRAPKLDELAQIAGFSKFHFHRIFRAVTGETILQCITRIKMERAAAYLLHSPAASITDIAYHYGFAAPAVFSRSFKQHFGVSPSVYRRKDRKNCTAQLRRPRYDAITSIPHDGSDRMGVQANRVDIKTEDIRVIYVRFSGSYPEMANAMPGMMRKIYEFSVHRNLLEYGKTKILAAYHDNPELTGETKLRVSLCMSVPAAAKIEPHDDIGVMAIAGSFAVGHFELYQQEYPQAWRHMYGEWLPNSGFQPRDAFPFECYVSDPSKNPGGKQLLDIYVPVEPLGPI